MPSFSPQHIQLNFHNYACQVVKYINKVYISFHHDQVLHLAIQIQRLENIPTYSHTLALTSPQNIRGMVRVLGKSESKCLSHGTLHLAGVEIFSSYTILGQVNYCQVLGPHHAWRSERISLKVSESYYLSKIFHLFQRTRGFPFSFTCFFLFSFLVGKGQKRFGGRGEMFRISPFSDVRFRQNELRYLKICVNEY